MNSIVTPSPSVASLQSHIREYVAILSLLKKKRAEIKTMNIKLREFQDEILESMISQRIPSCSSSGHTFTVKEKCKMKSATAKNFLVQVKEFFSLTDDQMEEFVTVSDNKRKLEAEVVTSLECKSAKKRIDQDGASASTDDVIGVSPLMSRTIDDMYDQSPERF